MKCKNCGNEIKDNQKFCPKCGAKVIAEIKVKANRKKTQALIICVCCFALVVSSVIGGVVWYKKNNNPQINESDKNYVYFDSDFSDIKITDVDSALEAISAVKNELGISDVHKELKVQSVDTVDNNTYYRFQQYYNDIPVYGRSVIINAENTKSKVLTSNFTNVDKDIAINKKIEEDKIKHSIVKYFNNTNVKLSPFSEDNFCIFYFDNSKRATLAYCCQVFDDENVYTCLLDSSTAEVLFMDAEMETVSAEVYSEDKKVSAIGWKNEDGSYHLYNEDYNISIFDVEGITTADENGEVKEDFRDYDIDTLYSKEGVFDKNAIILLDDIIKFNEYYKKLGNCTFDQIHGAINDEYENGNNARGGSTIVNGKNLAVILIGKNTGANDIDVIAHEYTHAVTDLIVNFTNTQNNRMPSAIDEAVSDIFGEIIESESNDKSPNWIMDSDAINLSRNISGNSGNQIYNLNDYNEKTSECHIASTIISHAAYLMWNGNGDGDIFKIDTDKLAKLWYRSLFLLQSDATFNQCANAVMLTAKSMQDTGDLTDAQVACVRRSFESVGIYPNDYLTKSSTNGANVHVKDINGNNLSSYYLKVTDEKSNVIIDSEFSDSKPYIVNVKNSGLYTFIVKQSKKSSVEYVTKVRILNINRDNSELNLQTALDLGENKKVTEDSEPNVNSSLIEELLNYYWENNIQSPYTYEFKDDNTVIEYMGISPNESKSSWENPKEYKYTLKNDTLIMYFGSEDNPETYSHELKYVTLNDEVDWDVGLHLENKIKENEQFFYEIEFDTSPNPNGPSGNAFYLKRGAKKDNNITVTNEITKSNEINKQSNNTSAITWSFDENSKTLTIKGKGKLTLNEEWINFKLSIEKIIIENGITEISSWLFSGYDNLKEIELPSSLKEIGNNAFIYDCSLERVSFPDGLKYIGQEAFKSCSSLENITLPNSLTDLGDGAFSGCSSVKKLYIGMGISILPFSAFSGNKSLESVNIPDNITELELYTFSGCSSLKKVIVGDSVKIIGPWAFSNCVNLTNILLGENVVELSKFSFSNCTSLKEIVLPDGLITIGEQAFKDCISLKSITMPSSINKISPYAISNCVALSDIYYSGEKSQWDKIEKGYDYGDTDKVLEHVVVHYL